MIKNCEICMKEFETSRNTKKYCSPECCDVAKNCHGKNMPLKDRILKKGNHHWILS